MPSGEQSRRNGVEAGRKKRAAGTMKRGKVDPCTCDREYTPAEVEFMNAMHAYRERYNRPFPTWSEALEVLVSLGYQKVAAEQERSA